MIPEATQAETAESTKRKWLNLCAEPIPDELANEIICEFRKGSGENTKAVWFDTDLLKTLLDFIINNGGSGARFYFGKYPDKDPFGAVLSASDGLTYDYKKQLTLIAVPTKKAGTEHRDIFKWNDCTGLKEKDITEKMVEAYNHGELCPPGKGCK